MLRMQQCVERRQAVRVRHSSEEPQVSPTRAETLGVLIDELACTTSQDRAA